MLKINITAPIAMNVELPSIEGRLNSGPPFSINEMLASSTLSPGSFILILSIKLPIESLDLLFSIFG